MLSHAGPTGIEEYTVDSNGYKPANPQQSATCETYAELGLLTTTKPTKKEG